MTKEPSPKDNKQLLDRKDNIRERNIEKVDDTKIHDHSIRNDTNTNIFFLICIISVSLAILLEIINVQNRKGNICKDNESDRRYYWVYSAYNDVENKNGLLKHVHLVLDRIGYEKSTNKTPWTLLWSHDYPFRVLYPNLHRLKSNQKVNHFPGTGFITNKVDLATSVSKYIPKAFKIPKNTEDFLKYANENSNALFLEKHNQHRGVFLKNVTSIDLLSGESFVQTYVQKPFLVDGHKFDIGVYVVLTSVDPLRVYWYKGDVLFRYCPAKYYPFDPSNLDKYVVGDDYLPTWEVPSLAHPYTALGFSMKEAFDHYARAKVTSFYTERIPSELSNPKGEPVTHWIRANYQELTIIIRCYDNNRDRQLNLLSEASIGKNTTRMWEEVQEAITEVFLNKEHHIIEALKNYPSKENFFEMMRFDLVIDEDFKVYLLEANMSPNLSSSHYPPNQLLYEQVLYNLFNLVGVARVKKNNKTAEKNMVSSQKNIAVYSHECSTICKEDCEASDVCRLCKPCLEPRLRMDLLNAHREYLYKGDFRRLFPPAMKQNLNNVEEMRNLSQMNKLQCLWYQGKCNNDITWCS